MNRPADHWRDWHKIPDRLTPQGPTNRVNVDLSDRVRAGIAGPPERASRPPSPLRNGAESALRFGEIRSGYNPGMARNEEIAALVKWFHDTGNLLTAKPAYTDEEMSLVDQAQVQHLEALQELVHRVSIAEAARLLGMTPKGVEDELRMDRSIE